MNRTRQAFLLGWQLTEVTGVDVTLGYVSGAVGAGQAADGGGLVAVHLGHLHVQMMTAKSSWWSSAFRASRPEETVTSS